MSDLPVSYVTGVVEGVGLIKCIVQQFVSRKVSKHILASDSRSFKYTPYFVKLELHTATHAQGNKCCRAGIGNRRDVCQTWHVEGFSMACWVNYNIISH